MDDPDDDDDLPYSPPIPRPSDSKPRRPCSSSSSAPRIKPSSFRNLPPPPPRFAARCQQHDDDDGDFEEDRDINRPSGDDVEDRNTRDYVDGEDDSSSESRGKRRRIDKPALGSEFTSRAPPAASFKPLAGASPPDWSEDSTFVLLDAWGDRYLRNGMKSLRSVEWSYVADRVSETSKVYRSDAQCRNRVDSLKKKYRKEKANMTGYGNHVASKWVYFRKMDALMSVQSLPPAQGPKQGHLPPSLRLLRGVDPGEYVFARSSVSRNCHDAGHEMRDSGTEDESDEGADGSDGLPPKRGDASGGSNSSFKILAESIHKFREIYEKIEDHKRQQMAELERMRRDFQSNLEVQKRLILERVQVDIAKLIEEQGEEHDEGDREADDDDGDDRAYAENLSGFIFSCVGLGCF